MEDVIENVPPNHMENGIGNGKNEVDGNDIVENGRNTVKARTSIRIGVIQGKGIL